MPVLTQLKEVIGQKDAKDNTTATADPKQKLKTEADKGQNKPSPLQPKQESKMDLMALASNPQVLATLNSLKVMYDEHKTNKTAHPSQDTETLTKDQENKIVLSKQDQNVMIPKNKSNKSKVKDFFSTLVKSPSSLFKKKEKQESQTKPEDKKSEDQKQPPKDKVNQHETLSLANLNDKAQKVNQAIEENIVLKLTKDGLLTKIGLKKP